MANLATMLFVTRAGSQLALEPHSGKSGAVGVFMPREGVDQFFPLPKYTEQYAESSDTEGGRRILSQVENATGIGTVVVAGDDEASFQTWHQRWQSLVEEMRREGGTLTYTPAEGVAVTYEIESMKITAAKYDGVMMLAFVQEFEFEFTCRPYGMLSSEEQTLRDHDPFTRDTIGAGEWAIFDVGSGTLSVNAAEGLLVPSSTAEKRLYRFGLKAADASTTIKVVTGASVASGSTQHMIKRLDSTNRLQAGVTFSGATTKLRIIKIDAGVETLFGESTSFTTTANTSYWLRTVTAGNVVSVSIYTSDPDTAQTPLKSFQVTLEGADAIKFGSGVYGNAGLRLLPSTGTDYRWDEWRWDAKQFRVSSPIADFELPEVKGHVEALAELTFTDMSNQSRRYADYGIEKGGLFTPSVAPPNLIDSDQLVTLGFGGAQTTRTGAYDPLASGNSVIRANLSTFPVVVCSTGTQSHVGPYRVKTRVHLDPREAGLAVGPAFLRFAASSSPSGPFTRGEWVRVPVAETWCDVDLGVAEAPPAKAGVQSWEVRVEALSEIAGDTIDVDYMEFFGASKYGKVKNATTYETPTLVTAQDQFNQSPEGAMSGKVIGNSSGEQQSKFPVTANQETGTEASPWSSPGNASGAPNGVAASSFIVQGDELADSTPQLFMYNNGFSIPGTATVKGIKVEVWKWAQQPAGIFGRDGVVKLMKNLKEPVGTSRGTASNWPASEAISTYGGETDLWGTTWTPAQINSENFGLAFSGSTTFPSEIGGSLNVDGIQITVYYQPSGGVSWSEGGVEAKEPKYTLKTATHLVERAGTGTDLSNKGRKMWVPGNFSSQAAQAELTLSTGLVEPAVMVRYKESPDQRLTAGVYQSGSSYKLRVIKFSGGVKTELQRPKEGIALTKTTGQTVLMRLQVEANGRWLVWADKLLVTQGYDPALATGELATGASGIYSECGGGLFAIKVDNFVCWTPEANSTLWAGRSLRFRSRDAIKENQEGSTWSPAAGYEGARLRLPPAGPAGLVSRLNVRGRRANIDEAIDEWIADEIQVGLRVTPRVVLLG